MDTGLTISHLSKKFASTPALVDVSFNLPEGETVAVLGPSGCGKSTLLNLIAGLEQPDDGNIFWGEQHLASIPPHQRNFGLMFQDYALFPHLNVYENLAFGLRMAHWQPEQIHNRVNTLLELINLRGFEKRDVTSLSGGEQQRVALARSLAPQPRLLMLDEPLGALDRTLREHLLAEMRQILRQMRQTAIYVTHDQEEAFVIADRILVMNQGCIVQTGAPEDIYSHPVSPFVAQFLGLENFFPGVIQNQNGYACLQTELGVFPLESQIAPGQVTVLLRPDSVFLNQDHPCHLTGTLVESVFSGRTQKATIAAGDYKFRFNFPLQTALQSPGSQITLTFDASAALQIFYLPLTNAPQ